MIEQCTSPTLARAVELLRCGFAVIPCGKGLDGKTPSVRWRTNKPLGHDAFTAKMEKSGATMYGIRLHGMVVLDVDERSDQMVAELEQLCGEAAVLVATPRGTHLYYRDNGAALPNFRTGSILVDVKRGEGHYTVGPRSIRPDGGEYIEIRGRLGETKLTPISVSPTSRACSPRMPNPTPPSRASKVQMGGRHQHLMVRAREFVPACETVEELCGNLLAVRDDDCFDPDAVSDGEVRDIALWTFTAYQEGRLYAKTGGSYQVPRGLARQLYQEPHALALYSVLLDNHGHRPRATFKLSFDGMKDGGLINMSERAFRRAVTKLREVGAIAVAKNHRAGVTAREYSLGSPSTAQLARRARPTSDFSTSGHPPS